MKMQTNFRHVKASLTENGFQSPRPTPKFLEEQTTFSQKKNRGFTPHKNGPPRPPLKSVPPVSRLFPNKTRQEESRPRAVSFRQSEPSVLQSPHYNENSCVSFFDQCFEVVHKLGEGSFGEVYKVRCKEDGKLYAVKRSRDRFKGEADKKRKLQEVRQHETLSRHPNCVEFFRAWAEKGHLYIQTELCQMSLEEYAETHHDMTERTVWDFLLDLIKGVKHLHDHNLLHLDIKPDNIFVSMYGVCKLGDFGLTVELEKNGPTEAQEGDPKYLAPELLKGKFGKPADVFSIGITILELACDLDLPQNGLLWRQLRDGNIPWDITKGISPELKDIVSSMMNPDYAERPSLQDILGLPVMRRMQRMQVLRSSWKKVWVTFSLYLTMLVSVLMAVLRVVLYPLSLTVGRSDESPPMNTNRPQRPSLWDLSFSDDEAFDTDVSHTSYMNSMAQMSFSSDDEKNKVFTASRSKPSASYISCSRPLTPLLSRSRRRTPLPRSSSPICHANGSFERWLHTGTSPNVSIVPDEAACTAMSSLRLTFDNCESAALNKSNLEPKNLMQIFDDACGD